LLTLKLGASSLVAAGNTAYKDAQDKVDKAAQAKARNYETYIKPWEDRRDDYEKIKNSVWKQAWDLQNPAPKDKPEAKTLNLVTWPRNPATDRIKDELDYPSSAISDKDIADYLRQYRDTLYLSQFKVKDADNKDV